MTATQDGIISCLQSLAGQPAGGQPCGDSQLPVGWLLLDLMAMLPSGSKAKLWAAKDPQGLAQDLWTAEQDSTAAAKAAGRLCQEISAHSSSLQQLGEFLLVSPAALALVLAGLQQAGDSPGAIAASISTAAWRSLAQSTGQLQLGSLAGEELRRAVGEAEVALDAAVQLTSCARQVLGDERAHQLVVKGVLQEQGSQLLAVLRACCDFERPQSSMGSGDSGSSSGVGAGRQRLLLLAGWWAHQACASLRQADHSTSSRVQQTSAGMARLFLSASLPELLGRRLLSLGSLQEGSLLHFTAVFLAGLVRCSKEAATSGAAWAADALLQSHNPDLVRLLRSLLTQPADRDIQSPWQAAYYGHYYAPRPLVGASRLYVFSVRALLEAVQLNALPTRVGDSQEILVEYLVEILGSLRHYGGAFQGWLVPEAQQELQAMSGPAAQALTARLAAQRAQRARQAPLLHNWGGSGASSGAVPSYMDALMGVGGPQGSSGPSSHPLPEPVEGRKPKNMILSTAKRLLRLG